MNDGKCTICMCDWTEHSNKPFRYMTSVKKEIGSVEEIFKSYLDPSSKESRSKQILDGLKKYVNNIDIEIILI